ncbi:MAG: hypothetical protein Q8P41_25525 [Pseudomonadota bacterium]|nr:hypothetical protein [Pseudomonadota bacterium]
MLLGSEGAELRHVPSVVIGPDDVRVELLSVLGAHDVRVPRVGPANDVLHHPQKERDQHEQRDERSLGRRPAAALLLARGQADSLTCEYYRR